MSLKILREAAADMRSKHGVWHVRHYMWATMADLLESVADRHGPHIECGNKGCRDRGLSGMHCNLPCEEAHEDCVDYAAALMVAHAYLEASERDQTCACCEGDSLEDRGNDGDRQ